MRIAEVIGTVTLSTRLEDVPPGKLLIVRPLGADALLAGSPSDATPVVAYDELGAGRGCRVAISEGREASAPFYPRRVPFDAYCAAIMDTVRIDKRDQTKGVVR